MADASRSMKMSLQLPLDDGSGRRAIDGLYIDNPRCFLLKEWARRDRDTPSGGQGYGFVMSRFGSARFMLGVEPSSGVNLRGLGGMINRREQAKRAALGQAAGYSWYEGDNAFFGYRIIDTPRDGTVLEAADILDALLAFGQGEVRS